MTTLAFDIPWIAIRNAWSLVGLIGAGLVGYGTIRKAWISPFIAKPIANAIKNEISDMVTEVVKTSPEIKDSFRSVITEELGPLVTELGEMDAKLDGVIRSSNSIKASMTHIKGRLKNVEANMGITEPVDPPVKTRRRVAAAAK